jgi:hypothetical protein
MLHENFIKKVEQESPEFQALMNILSPLNEHFSEGRKLLCLVNHILDFYILSERESDDVRMPIVYFPLCEDWAQLLCEEFVSLKMSLLWGENTRTDLISTYRRKPYIDIPCGANKRCITTLTKQFRFRRDVEKWLKKDILSYPFTDVEKCFLYSRNISNEYHLSLKTPGHYHFCQEIMDHTFSTKKSLILLGEDEKEVYSAIEKNDGAIKIPNIILFLQRDLDGRNTPLCMQMQRSTINEYNEDYDAGIKNVISFSFSQKPYRLQRIYENKHNLVERLQREKISKTRDFISFTKEEMDYIFGREKGNISFFELNYEEGSEQKQIKNAFDLMFQDMPHEVNLRNELAICFTEQSMAKIQEIILEQNPEANEEYTDYFLRLIQNEYKGQLLSVLFDWINFHQIAVVLDYNIDMYFKNQLIEFLKSDCGATSVTLYTFKNLKAHKDGNIFLNSIKENKILVLSMLNHCTGRTWAIYPNSFDQYYLNPGQSVLQINNRIVFDPRFSWYKYRYSEQLKLLLTSDFRIKSIKSGIVLPPKPLNVGAEPKDDDDEQNARNRMSSGREQKRITISFGPRQHRVLDEDELVLCQYEDDPELFICTISDIQRDFDDPTKVKIQPLVDFHQPLEVFIDNEERKIGDGESIMRKTPMYGLSELEIASNCEMWKILLGHCVARQGEQVVFNDIMKPLLPAERIQFSSFRRWLDSSESSILPRSRRMQKRVIEEYLQIDPLYTRMLRHRKSRMSTNTEDKNSIFKTFLTHCLLEPDTQKAYDVLSNEVRDYLDIDSKNDIQIIIDLIKDETLNVKQIKSIKYD